MLTRRRILQSGCALCAALLPGSGFHDLSVHAAAPATISGPGYSMRFVGAQREAIMTGRRSAILDLRTLQNEAHVYGIGPLEGLAGEVTIVNNRPSLARVGADRRVHVEESFEGGVPFFVWADVPEWQELTIPSAVRSCADLETFLGEAGQVARLSQAFPFLLRGCPALVDFHVVDAKPDTPFGMAAHQLIQIPFELRDRNSTLVGFWSNQHQGIFTPMGVTIHVHFQTDENDASGHVQGLDLAGGGMTLSLPKG
jgi:acetolactate decarboxylase